MQNEMQKGEWGGAFASAGQLQEDGAAAAAGSGVWSQTCPLLLGLTFTHQPGAAASLGFSLLILILIPASIS